VLYGLDKTAARKITDGVPVVIADGALDVEAVKRSGADVVPLAACGTALTTFHLDALRALTPGLTVIEALDGDEAGQAAAVRLWDMLTDTEAEAAGSADMGDGDPADYIMQGRGADLAYTIERPKPLVNVVIKARAAECDLTTVEGRIQALRRAVEPAGRLSPHAAAAALIGAAHATDSDVSEAIAEGIAQARAAAAR
jgi:DNA primase